MATLSQVYTNVGFGVVVATASCLIFGVAVQFELNRNLTPRAWARPVSVVKNVLSRPYSLGWFTWSLSVKDVDLLSGIPGTGTRNQGRSGPMLRTNLDGVLMLRFHTLQCKVALLATILCIAILLPLYKTAPCDPLQSGANLCQRLSNHTDFEELTFANVPPHRRIDALKLDNGTIMEMEYFDNSMVNLSDISVVDVVMTYQLQWIPGITERYLAYTVTTALISFYTCYLMWYEWIECLALRRVYYLESEYYEERLDELDEIYNNDDPEDPFQKVRPPFLPHPELRETIPNVSLHSALYKLPRNLAENILFDASDEDDDKSFLERELEAAVEFFDQCVPTQLGFTSSVVAVTMVPDATKITKVWGQWYRCGAAMRRLRYIKAHLNYRRHMQRTGQKGLHDFFVAAPTRATTETIGHIRGQAAKGFDTVTEIAAHGIEVIQGLGRQHPPGSYGEVQELDPEMPVLLTEATDDAAGQSQKDEIPYVEARGKNEDCNSVGNILDGQSTTPAKSQTSLESSISVTGAKNPIVSSDVTPKPSQFDEAKLYNKGTKRENPSMFKFKFRQKQETFEYHAFDPATFAEWIGYSEETELDQIVDTLEIEQLSVYAREISQSASNPCVYGCAPELIRFASIQQLETMLEDAWATAREANASLLSARSEMFRKVGADNAGLPALDDAFGKKKDDKNESSNRLNMLTNDAAGNRSKQDQTTDKPTIGSLEKKEVDDTEISAITSSHNGHNLSMSDGLRQRWKRRAKTNQTKYDLVQDLVKETNTHSQQITVAVDRNSIPIHDSPSYCVVTFTSRHAAVAARQCMADGKGINAWQQIHKIPMYPLADAPPGNIFFCRGYCRPVTLTIPESQKRTRLIFFWVFYISFCFLYTIPITLISTILNPTWLADFYPNNPQLNDPNNFFFKTLAGISSGYVQSIFFSILPQIFKILAFFEGSSSSLAKAEEKAMRYYWFFMLVTSFAGAYLLQMLINGLVHGNFGNEVTDLLGTVAASTATQLAPVWLNWIIVKTINAFWLDLCQFMTFTYGFLRIHWLNRVMRGGGPGGQAPYRKYIDSGVVFMCITALAPTCPLIAPAGLLFYSVSIPMLRWMHIFVYRPKYDGGGNLLPVLHEILVSSLILGHVLLGFGLYLKESFIFGTIILLMTVPTYLFGFWTKEKFMASYEDAGLWQVSKLDGSSKPGTVEEREKYRRWLVDCHKASFVPMCLAGGEDFLTYQPASVVPIDRDLPRNRTSTSKIGTKAGNEDIL